jgi:hypothetical protein
MNRPSTRCAKVVTVWRTQAHERGNASVLGQWAERAACRGADVEVFFDVERDEEARGYCHRCPVARECGEAGRGETFGVWGGVRRRGR